MCMKEAWRTRGTPVVHCVWLLAGLVLLTSCGIGVRTRALTGGKVHVEVRTADTANQNHPVAMDVLLVYDRQWLTDLAKLSASEWFDKRDQLKRDDPDGKAFNTWSWEWVPGQHTVITLPLEAKARGGMIFAQYGTRGEHRARFDPHSSMVVELLEKGFSVRPMP